MSQTSAPLRLHGRALAISVRTSIEIYSPLICSPSPTLKRDDMSLDVAERSNMSLDIASRPGMRLTDDLVPSRYALQVGEIDVMVISDGVLPLPASTLATNADAA